MKRLGAASYRWANKWLFEIESAPGEDAVDIVEVTRKYWEYYINWVDKAVAGFERIDFNFKKGSTEVNMLSNSSAWYRETIYGRKRQLMGQTSLLSYFKKLPQPPRPLPSTTWSVSMHQHLTGARPSTSTNTMIRWKAQKTALLAIKCFLMYAHFVFRQNAPAHLDYSLLHNSIV